MARMNGGQQYHRDTDGFTVTVPIGGGLDDGPLPHPTRNPGCDGPTTLDRFGRPGPVCDQRPYPFRQPAQFVVRPSGPCHGADLCLQDPRRDHTLRLSPPATAGSGMRGRCPAELSQAGRVADLDTRYVV